MSKVRVYKAIFRISIAILIIGTLFRIMHWPFGMQMSAIALILIAISSVLFYSSRLEKSFVDELAVVLVPFLCVFMLLRLLHLPYQLEIKIALLAIAVLYIFFKGIQWHLGDQSQGKTGINWERNSYILGIILIAIGLFFKYQYWPYAKEFLLSGMGVMVLYYVVPLFSKGDE